MAISSSINFSFGSMSSNVSYSPLGPLMLAPSSRSITTIRSLMETSVKWHIAGRDVRLPLFDFCLRWVSVDEFYRVLPLVSRRWSWQVENSLVWQELVLKGLCIHSFSPRVQLKKFILEVREKKRSILENPRILNCYAKNKFSQEISLLVPYHRKALQEFYQKRIQLARIGGDVPLETIAREILSIKGDPSPLQALVIEEYLRKHQKEEALQFFFANPSVDNLDTIVIHYVKNGKQFEIVSILNDLKIFIKSKTYMYSKRKELVNNLPFILNYITDVEVFKQVISHLHSFVNHNTRLLLEYLDVILCCIEELPKPGMTLESKMDLINHTIKTFGLYCLAHKDPKYQETTNKIQLALLRIWWDTKEPKKIWAILSYLEHFNLRLAWRLLWYFHSENKDHVQTVVARAYIEKYSPEIRTRDLERARDQHCFIALQSLDE